ncbi:predicted GPI-anchored protein 58 [Fopius arisanus]|uniref:Predicted GPI-anchored protein 58 n=1 Tax=Fopius arisanus TaxID=64838 RepID=A0A9R1TQ64_9HYME|nr:PREDICTED: predicted GPI-anchored protein 58 [Fopius arisanus]
MSVDADQPTNPDTISPDVSENVDDSPESSAPVGKGMVDSPASPDPESPESPAAVEKPTVDSPASPDPECPESPAAVEKPTVDSPASPDPESPESPAPEEKGLVDSPESPAPEDSNSMEMDPPDSTISDVAPVIPVNVETAPPNSADDTEPFVRVEEAACPPADDDDNDDMEPVRIFVPEEWEGVMSERAMMKKLREIINRHYKVGGTFVTMGDVRAKLIFCPHGNIYFRPMGSFKHPNRLSTNIKIYPEL